MTEVRPKISEETKDFLNNKETVLDLFKDSKEPKHVLFPGRFQKNVEELEETFSEVDILSSIYFAHKPTKSPVIINEAEKAGIRIDVASREELESALDAGFEGERIECTGPKDTQFLEEAVEEGCLISLDSLYELEELEEILKEQEKTIELLVRINNPQNPDRDLSLPVSKFGIDREKVENVIEHLSENETLSLKGFHFHNDVREADANAGFVADCFELIKKSYGYGLRPDTINIGGGLRKNQLEDLKDWSRFLAQLEEDIIENRQTETWRDNGYGMHLNLKGRVSGRDKLQGRFTDRDHEEVLKGMFKQYKYNGRSLGDQLTENMFQIMTEPGKLLLDHCGATFMKVLGTKELPTGEKLVSVNANKYNLSGNMTEQLMDPVHIPLEESGKEGCEAFIGGNLCLEGDLLVRRKIGFKQEPERGDVICFINTISNYADFEDAAPHMHPRGARKVAVKSEDWKIMNEEEYLKRN